MVWQQVRSVIIDFRMGISEKNMREQFPQILSCFFLLLVLLLLHIKPANAKNTASDRIVLGSSLTGNQTRISKGGIFKFGFFNLHHNNVEKWYVGIWYAHVSQQTVVWVANVQQPLENSSSVLNLTDEGSLLLSYGRSTIWSSKGNGNKPSSAVITDSGNLVVVSAKNNTQIIWQSFDYPQNTWLGGMKFSNSQRLSAWRSSWDPSPGPFTLRMDPNGAVQFVLMWNNDTTYWQSGLWNSQSFSNVPDYSADRPGLTYFRNGSSMYFTSTLPTEYRIFMDKSGQVRTDVLLENKEWIMGWQRPLTQCEVYAICGPYGSCNNNNVQSCNCVPGFIPRDSQEWKSQQWSSGCVRKTPLRCSHARNQSSTDRFVEISGTSVPSHGVEYKGQNRCQEACLSNCSCTAYAYVNGTSQRCVMWFSELLNLYDTSNGISLFLRLDAADVPHSVNSNKKTKLAGVVGGVVGGLLAILAFVLLFIWFWKRFILLSTEYVPAGLTLFTYRALQNATKKFSERLGGGGFGSVFKGTLADGSPVAVKKLESVSQGEKQFCMEVSTIGVAQHVNLVRLLGFCTEGSQRLLVYEYMPNGSLSSFLFKKSQRNDEQHKLLNWKTRFSIAVGTARGIVYLHEKCKDRIIHCDIKPENILLDSNFCPKVADFGMAKLLGREYSKVLTTIRGTRGYLAPEWLSGLPITVKADVYSFGITLLEIIAGQRNMDKVSESSELFFPAWAATHISNGNGMEVLDKELLNDADAEQVERAATVAGWCIQDEEEARPSMSEVLQILEGIVNVPPLPPIPHSLDTCDDGPVVVFWDKSTSTACARNDTASPSTPL